MRLKKKISRVYGIVKKIIFKLKYNKKFKIFCLVLSLFLKVNSSKVMASGKNQIHDSYEFDFYEAVWFIIYFLWIIKKN